MFFRSGYNYDRDEASLESGLKCEDKSLTVQSEKDDADINVIMKRAGITGAIPVHERVPLAEGFYGEFNLREAMDIVKAGHDAFMAQPADVRSRFGNDPVAFVEFFGKKENTEEAIKLGLATAKPEPVVAPAKPV